MVASVNFTAAQSEKYLRITDLYPDKQHPKASGLLKVGEKFTVNIETFDEKTGLAKVEVSRDGKAFATHAKRMPVVHGQTYPIDDSKLPAGK